MAIGPDGQQNAAVFGHTVDQHRTGAALSGLTAFFHAGQTKPQAQHIGQALPLVDSNLPDLSVDGTIDHFNHQGSLLHVRWRSATPAPPVPESAACAVRARHATIRGAHTPKAPPSEALSAVRRLVACPASAIPLLRSGSDAERPRQRQWQNRGWFHPATTRS